MSKINWNGLKVKRTTKAAAVKGLSDGLEFFLDECNKNVPHAEGNLERSGDIDLNARKLKGTVFYDTPYAAYQHETPGLEYQDPKAEHKWMEKKAKNKAIRNQIRDHIAKQIKSALD